MTGAAAHRVRSMTTALRRVLVGPTSASFGSSRRAESCSLFCRLPYDHDLRVGVHRLPHPKMQGDLESCLTRVRRVIPAYFDHPPCEWPRLETRALKVRAQVLGELGFLDRDQQSAAAFWWRRSKGEGAEPRRIGLGKLTIAAAAGFTRPLFSGSSSAFTSPRRGRRVHFGSTYRSH